VDICTTLTTLVTTLETGPSPDALAANFLKLAIQCMSVPSQSALSSAILMDRKQAKKSTAHVKDFMDQLENQDSPLTSESSEDESPIPFVYDDSIHRAGEFMPQVLVRPPPDPVKALATESFHAAYCTEVGDRFEESQEVWSFLIEAKIGFEEMYYEHGVSQPVLKIWVSSLVFEEIAKTQLPLILHTFVQSRGLTRSMTQIEKDFTVLSVSRRGPSVLHYQ
jgi:hypothetical protein